MHRYHYILKSSSLQNCLLYRSGNTIRSSSSSAVHSDRLRHGKGPAARHGGVWSRAPRDGGADAEEARVDAVAVVEADLAWADVCDGFIMIQFVHDTATILETRNRWNSDYCHQETLHADHPTYDEMIAASCTSPHDGVSRTNPCYTMTNSMTCHSLLPALHSGAPSSQPVWPLRPPP